ncbi:MAG: sensor histidine kinase [Acidimicrobiia bacterium]|jgi:signal transduction histidine kinase
MSRQAAQSPRSLLDQLANTYLKTRPYLGLSLIALTVLIVTLEVGGESPWVVAVAGAVIVVHALGARALDMNDPNIALTVDITAAMTAALVFSGANSNQTPILLTFVGGSVLIALFSERLARVAILLYTAVFGFVALLMVQDWDLKLALGDYIGAVFLSALVIGLVAVIKQRIYELEAAKTQTLGAVGHELKNHLAAVVAAVELVRSEDLSVTERDELLQLARFQAAEAGEVIEDLLVASRADTGSLDSIPDNIDLCPIAESVIRQTSLEDGDVLYDFSGRHAWATADPVRFKQIVRNLLINALRYGGEEIRVSIESVGDIVSVVVADNGDGVDPDSEDDLFRPFPAGREDHGVPESNGLGLWIARGLARAMNGDLTYTRNSGQTVFELTLPAGHDPGLQGPAGAKSHRSVTGTHL